MQRRNRRAKPRHTVARHPSQWAAIKRDGYSLQERTGGLGSSTPDKALEFGRFRVLWRRRQLLADGTPVELGTRAFDLLLVLVEADGALVSKEELMRRVWRGIVVSEENLKVQVSALRKALGADRNIIRTEFGRGYRLTAVLTANSSVEPCQRPARPKLHSGPTFLAWSCRQSLRRACSSS